MHRTLRRSLLIFSALLVAGSAPPARAEAVPGDANYFQKLQEVRSERQRSLIREFFAGRRGGVFVDVGSAHYRDLNMTYFLERDFGWSGVAIDALERWRPGYEKHRPQTRFYTYIVTDHAGTQEPFFRLEGDIGSTSLPGRADLLENDWNREVTEILVPTTTLDALLAEAGVEKVDFLSMDIEGAELTALAAFDIERFRPQLVGIEVFPENQQGILDYFERHGYRRIDEYAERHHGDWFFTCKVPASCAPQPSATPAEPSAPPEGATSSPPATEG